VAERDVVDVDEDFVLALAVPDLAAGVPSRELLAMGEAASSPAAPARSTSRPNRS
jgi:hypothetical protein